MLMRVPISEEQPENTGAPVSISIQTAPAAQRKLGPAAAAGLAHLRRAHGRRDGALSRASIATVMGSARLRAMGRGDE